MVEAILVPAAGVAVKTTSRVLGLTPRTWLFVGGGLIVMIVGGVALVRVLRTRAEKNNNKEKEEKSTITIDTHFQKMSDRHDALHTTLEEISERMQNMNARHDKQIEANADALEHHHETSAETLKLLNKIAEELRNTNKLNAESQAALLGSLGSISAKIGNVEVEIEAAPEGKPSKNGAKPPPVKGHAKKGEHKQPSQQTA